MQEPACRWAHGEVVELDGRGLCDVCAADVADEPEASGYRQADVEARAAAERAQTVRLAPAPEGVNPPLTVKRRAARTESDEYGAFVGRILRAYTRRVSDRDIEGLARLAELRDDVDVAILQAVAALHATGHYSWADIGRTLGITRQAAQQRYGRAR